MVEPDRPQTTHAVHAIACRLTKEKNTDTHSEYLIFIAFPCQQYLRDRACMLRYSTLPDLLVLLTGNKNMVDSELVGW